ncbi:MAG: hypothetical protein KGI25_00130 [Thaumarchaeota archaeon]|nr:hypothetical protein [Nitrososphaerota archaeon]
MYNLGGVPTLEGTVPKDLSFVIDVIKNGINMLHLVIFLVIFVALFSYFIKPSAAESQENVKILNIRTIPPTVHVGDNFTISAMIINNSTNLISFNDACGSPLSAVFEKNVAASSSLSCFALSVVYLKPGQNINVTGPGLGTLYNATDTGLTNGNVTFAYKFGGTNNVNVSEPFSFTIYQTSKETVPEFSPVALVLVAATTSVIVLSTRWEWNSNVNRFEA